MLGLGLARFFVSVLNVIIVQFMMATTNRGQSPARQTKVMDSYPGPLKKGRAQKKLQNKVL